MSGSEIHLQHDMFTRERVDNRSRRQKRADEQRQEPQQQAMFKLSELLGTETRAKPVIDTSNLASETLVLISEDRRSEEEKEAALRCAAEALTQAMFAEAADEQPDVTETSHAARAETTDEEKETVPLEKQPQSPQESAYLELVEVVCERITTLWIDSNYETQFHLQLASAILAAQDVGLTLSEISIAIQIGKHLGEQKRLALDVQLPTLSENNGAVFSEIPSQKSSKTTIIAGFRARMRRESRNLRRRRMKQAA